MSVLPSRENDYFISGQENLIKQQSELVSMLPHKQISTEER